MIQKQGHWVPYELKPRDVERRFGTCELLLQRQRRNGFLRRQQQQLLRDSETTPDFTGKFRAPVTHGRGKSYRAICLPRRDDRESQAEKNQRIAKEAPKSD
ncbi:MOS1T transposase, partial [Pseudoatta argentina]